MKVRSCDAMNLLIWCTVAAVVSIGALAVVGDGDGEEDGHHPRPRRDSGDNPKPAHTDQEYWNNVGQDTLKTKLSQKINKNVAKNVIFFLGDGMSVPTLTAARIYKGQLSGKDGEEDSLSFEEFPFSGLSRTYCVDSQVADSACTATAYLCGVKGNLGTIGVSGNVKRTDCEAMRNVSNHVYSIAAWAQEAGKSTGFVTTTRVTHASPAGLYAHTADRDWEDDVGVAKSGNNATHCPDIAVQLIYDKPGIDFNVIMGGGRRAFYSNDKTDAQGLRGRRQDGRNLIEVWETDKIKRRVSYAYITTRNHLLTLDPIPDYLLGLFAHSHMDFHLDATPTEPLLEEMTAAAIRVLEKNPNGFVLFVEGGKIDLAHHDNLAQKSLDETVEFSKAVSIATRLTSEDDTLIVVTADHAHVMTLSGYPKKGNNIFGFAGSGVDGLSYPTLSYANGPGFWKTDLLGKRYDIRKFNTEGTSFKFPAMVPLQKETHGGDDVAVFARGPWSHLFSGSYEQHFIPHAIRYASCLGDDVQSICRDKKAWEEIF